MHSLREVASRINSGVDLPGLLFDLAKTACDHGGWSMGSIMSFSGVERLYKTGMSGWITALLSAVAAWRWGSLYTADGS